jgi:hypothetical protein
VPGQRFHRAEASGITIEFRRVFDSSSVAGSRPLVQYGWEPSSPLWVYEMTLSW